MSTFRSFLITAVAAIAFLLAVPATAAHAHDVLVDQDPADGEVLETAPEKITLTFNNNLIDLGENATVMRLLDANGETVIDEAPTISGMQAVQQVEGLTDGAYRLVWRVVSSDGHPITGVSTFAVGTDGANALAALPPLDEAAAADDSTGDTTSDIAEQPGAVPNLSPAMITLIAVAGVGLIVTLILLVLKKGKTP